MRKRRNAPILEYTYRVCKHHGLTTYQRTPALANPRWKCSKCIKHWNSGEYRLRANLKHKYNMTLEERDEIVANQGSICPICSVELDNNNMRVDHCHDTDIVRGVLCNSCNTGIGLMKDNRQNLARAIEYLGRNFAAGAS